MPQRGWSKRKPTSIDDYLANVPPEQRAALERLRKTIHSAAPGLEECVSYSLPAFRLGGKLVAGFGASANHCAYYPMSGAIVDAHAEELATYETSKGTIRFRPEQPLPVALVRRLVRARIAEGEQPRRTRAAASTRTGQGTRRGAPNSPASRRRTA